jgi:cyanate lyase
MQHGRLQTELMDRLLFERIRREVTNRDLAKQLGHEVDWVSRRLLNKTAVTLDQADELAAALGLQIAITITRVEPYWEHGSGSSEPRQLGEAAL